LCASELYGSITDGMIAGRKLPRQIPEYGEIITDMYT